MPIDVCLYATIDCIGAGKYAARIITAAGERDRAIEYCCGIRMRHKFLSTVRPHFEVARFGLPADGERSCAASCTEFCTDFNRDVNSPDDGLPTARTLLGLLDGCRGI